MKNPLAAGISASITSGPISTSSTPRGANAFASRRVLTGTGDAEMALPIVRPTVFSTTLKLLPRLVRGIAIGPSGAIRPRSSDGKPTYIPSASNGLAISSRIKPETLCPLTRRTSSPANQPYVKAW